MPTVPRIEYHSALCEEHAIEDIYKRAYIERSKRQNLGPRSGKPSTNYKKFVKLLRDIVKGED